MPTVPGEPGNLAYGVSGDGSVIVGTNYTGAPSYAFHAFRWTAQTGNVDLQEPAGGTYSGAYAISTDGSVITGFTGVPDSPKAQAFRWTASTGMIALGLLPGELTVRDMAFQGMVRRSSATLATWRCAGPPQLAWSRYHPCPARPAMPALCASADGSVVDGYGTIGNHNEAFVWTAKTGTVDLGTLPGAGGSAAGGVSADGSRIVGTSGGAFLWSTTTGMLNLQNVLLANGATGLDGWTLGTANNISPDGAPSSVTALIHKASKRHGLPHCPFLAQGT